MTKKEKLYETLGELLYTIAKADGIIQDDERIALDTMLKNHAWASTIKWSFDYEAKRNASVEETYSKVINSCHAFGPSPEYYEFIDAMRFVAMASDGIDKNEASIISSFSKDLIERFQRDIDTLQ